MQKIFYKPDVYALPVDKLQYVDDHVYAWSDDICFDITGRTEIIAAIEEAFSKGESDARESYD